MSTTTRLTTADELLTLPTRDEHGNDCRLELIRGEVRRMSPTGVTHGVICSKLNAVLAIFVEEHDLGIVCGAETGFTVERNPDSVIAADVAFISNSRLVDIENPDKFAPFAPDIAVEVLSPSNTATEMNVKLALYFAAGALAVWIVSPKHRTVAVYASPSEFRILGEDDTLDGGDVLPGFGYELSKLFVIKR